MPYNDPNEDYTGIKIKDTYQSVIHIGGSGSYKGRFFDGTGSLIENIIFDKIVADEIIANELIVTEVSRSIIYASGSTRFGDTLDDKHQFTGSVYISGSEFLYNGNSVVTSDQTSSIQIDSASYSDFAVTASHALNIPAPIDTSSFLTGDDTGSFITNEQTSSMSVLLSETASFIEGSNVHGLVNSSSYALTASYVENLPNVYISSSRQDVILGETTISGSLQISGSGYINGEPIITTYLSDDDTTAPQQYYYIGRAMVGSVASDSVWKIARVERVNQTRIITYADGNTDFDNIYDNRESLSYS